MLNFIVRNPGDLVQNVLLKTRNSKTIQAFEVFNHIISLVKLIMFLTRVQRKSFLQLAIRAS